MTSRPAIASQPSHRIPQWLLVLSILLVVGAWSAWDVYIDYKQVVEQEYRLLDVRARQHEARISGALRSVNLMLGSIIDDLHDHPGMSVADQNRLLKDYLRQLPEIDNLLVTDASGHIQADTYEKIIGLDVAHREYFKSHRDAPENDGFHISVPFKTVLNRIATTESRVIRDSQGHFAGVVAATLDSGFFNGALALFPNESGIQAVLINRNGDILNIVPASQSIGKNLQGGYAYTEHMKSGQPTTRHLGINKFAGVVKMSVLHDLPGAPLTVIVSRPYEDVLAEWQHSLLVHLGGFLLLTFTTLFFSWLAARRQGFLIRARRQIAERELELRTVIETEPDCVKQLASDGTLLNMNSAGLRMLEADSPDQVIGMKMQQLVLPEYREAFVELVQRVFAGQSDDLVFELRGLKGGHCWLETHAVPLRDAHENIVALLGITRDITERKRMEDQVRQLAFYDPLTQLPNRRLLHDRLNQIMAASKRTGCHGAVMFLDLDNFKPLNDTHGHEVGDLLLIEVAERLKNCVRETDTVGRFGGDEFVVILSELNSSRDASTTQARIVAEKVRDMLAEPYKLSVKRDGLADTLIEHRCTASIGVALFIDHEASQDEIIKWADTAMYAAKEAGRNMIRFHATEAQEVTPS